MHINDIGSYVKDAIGDASVDCMVVKQGSKLTGSELKAMQKELELTEDKVIRKKRQSCFANEKQIEFCICQDQ